MIGLSWNFPTKQFYRQKHFPNKKYLLNSIPILLETILVLMESNEKLIHLQIKSDEEKKVLLVLFRSSIQKWFFFDFFLWIELFFFQFFINGKLFGKCRFKMSVNRNCLKLRSKWARPRCGTTSGEYQCIRCDRILSCFHLIFFKY